MCNFLWTGSVDNKKLITVPWHFCCMSFKEDGIGIKWLKELNEAMLSKSTWLLITSYGFASSVLRNHFLYPSSLPEDTYFQSSMWSSIKHVYTNLRAEVRWLLGSTSKLNFWTDEWLVPSVTSQMNIAPSEQRNLYASISEFLVND